MKETYIMLEDEDLTTDDHDYNSPSLNCKIAEKFLIQYSLTETGTLVNGDRVRILVEFSDDETTWYGYYNGPFGALYEEESTTPCDISVSGDCEGEYMRITVTTDYTNATPANNYFTVTVKITLV